MRNNFLLCVDNNNYEASLENFKVYHRVPDAIAARHHQVRIIDESGEDYLYPDECFVGISLPTSVRKAIKKHHTAT